MTTTISLIIAIASIVIAIYFDMRHRKVKHKLQQEYKIWHFQAKKIQKLEKEKKEIVKEVDKVLKIKNNTIAILKEQFKNVYNELSDLRFTYNSEKDFLKMQFDEQIKQYDELQQTKKQLKACTEFKNAIWIANRELDKRIKQTEKQLIETLTKNGELNYLLESNVEFKIVIKPNNIKRKKRCRKV